MRSDIIANWTEMYIVNNWDQCVVIEKWVEKGKKKIRITD